MKYSKYFGAKWHGFIKSESILAPKGASQIKSENTRCDIFCSQVLPFLRLIVDLRAFVNIVHPIFL